MVITEKAYGKINLYLHITGKRNDGYHLLDTLMLPVNIYDKVKIKPANKFSISLSGQFSENIPLDENNIAAKAAKVMAKASGENKNYDNIEINIKKNIPVGAGMAGGSANAAAVMRGLNILWDLNYSIDKLANIGIEIGADIPFCLHQKPAFVSGIGEIIEPIKYKTSLNIVLVNPLIEVSTPKVFQAGVKHWSGKCKKPQSDNPSSADFINFIKNQTNDLLDNALIQAPEINEVITTIEKQEGCIFSRMSGSGSTCFGVFKDKESAQNATIEIKKKSPKWWVY